jgi:predicted MPP superfamily phosphohydrolase
MKLRVLSDLHAEFWSDQEIEEWVRMHLSDPDAAVLVLAGDIDMQGHLTFTLSRIAETWDRPIVYVLGNHEFYESTRDRVLEEGQALDEQYDHLHVLENDSVTIDGQRFLGTTLWFREREDDHRYRNQLNDFHVIKGGFNQWVYDVNESARQFLREGIDPGDAVVTHHSPTERTIAEEYEGDPLNRFFVCGMEGVIQSSAPAVWIHGHHHDSSQARVGETPVVCNPYGYRNHEVNPDFDAHKIVEV